ncbi:MAG: DJ-1/PfpI family protein [Erysipelotrichaceae bacterium]|nr:DJ-1/PfpI family protein [Erysipelotrichaceae bacterium]
MKVLLLCPKAFETMEFSVFIDVIGWARNDFGHDIDVVTCGFQKTVISTFQVPIQMDILIDDIIVSDYDALAIPGGFREFGFFDEGFDPKTKQLIREFDSQGKPIASVCVAAFLLANSGILKGRKATTYHLHQGIEQQKLAEYNVCVVDEPVVIDANVITSYCPQTAPDVAFALLEMLTTHEAMLEVKHAMGFEADS